jgi:thymidylate kinase
MKAEYEEQIKINGSLADQVKKLEDLQKAYGFIGLSGTAKIKKEFMDLNDSIRKNELSVNDLENRLTRFRDFMKEGLGLSEASQAEMNRLSGQLLLLTSTIKTQQQEQANLSKEYDHEEAAKAAQHGKEMVAIATAIAEAKLAANKRSADANADLWAATGKLLLAQGQISATLELQMTRDSAQAKYNAELSYQQELLALLEKDPTKNAARIIAQNAGIESLETEHLAKLAEARANFEALQKSIKERIVETIAATVPATVELTEEEKKQLAVVTALEAAYKALGMTGITMYDEMARHAREDYEIVARAAGTGMASQLDWMVAYQKALQADINAKKQAGVATVALQKDLDLLTKSIEKLAGATPKVKTEKLRAEFHDLARTVADGTTTFKTAASVIGEEFAQGIGQAVAAAETGSEGIGKAMEKMAASVLSSISSMCIVQAIYETAMGLGDLANPALEQYAAGHFVAAAEFAAGAVAAGLGAMAMSGGSGGSSGGSSSSSSTATPASGNGISGSAGTAGNNPSQTVNVQRFATGGLVSSPTLAVIGDSINSASEGSREAALPLDDPRAMSAIADAITERMQASGGGGGGDSHFHFPNLKGIVSPDVLDTVIDQVNTRVNGGKRLLASEARRTVRRS